MQWHKVTLTLDGPFAHERDLEPNPFTDHCLTVTFTHESGSPKYVVPGFFAADGNAGNTSAESGTKWRAHLAPDKPGKWTYAISFTTGKHVAVGDAKGDALTPFDGRTGTLFIAPTDKTGRDFRGRGRLEYVGKHYLQFAGSKEYFLKAGPDAPENLLAYADFDGTRSNKRRPAARAGLAARRPGLEGRPRQGPGRRAQLPGQQRLQLVFLPALQRRRRRRRRLALRPARGQAAL
jgi:hypothetical protein